MASPAPQRRPPPPDAEAIGLALEAAGLSAYLLAKGSPAPSMFPEVRIAWDGEAFQCQSGEDLDLPHLGAEAAMEIQLEARAVARQWAARWTGGVGPEGMRVAFAAEAPFAPGEVPAIVGARLHEAAARLHVAHLLLRQRAVQIAWAHAGKGPFAHEGLGR